MVRVLFRVVVEVIVHPTEHASLPQDADVAGVNMSCLPVHALL